MLFNYIVLSNKNTLAHYRDKSKVCFYTVTAWMEILKKIVNSYFINISVSVLCPNDNCGPEDCVSVIFFS